MANSVIGALRVVLGLDSAQFSTGIKRARRELSPLEKGMGTLSTAAKSLGAALGAASVGLAAREFLSLADQSKTLTAQLKLATAQFGSFAKAQEDVKRIAAVTRTDIAATADLYATLQRNAGELGISQQEAARATESITKAFRISGATAAEAAGGLRQFLQGIQSGTLRGEELNSVLENAPRLARALADGLGVTIGQLRAMGQAGELTGRQVLDALGGAAEQIDKEFAELPKTFDEAMTTVHNAAVLTFGAFDRGGQFSTALANFITQGSQGFGDLERWAGETGATIRAAFEGLYNVFNPMLAGASRVFNIIDNQARSLASRIAPLFRELDWIVNKKREIGDLFTVYGPGESRNLPKSNLEGQFWKRVTGLRREAGLTPVSKALGRLSDSMKGNASPPPVASPFGGGGGGGGGRKTSGGGGGGGTRKSEAAREADDFADALRNLLDKIDPTAASLRKYREDMELVARAQKEGKITADQAADALQRLSAQNSDTLKTFMDEYGKPLEIGKNGITDWAATLADAADKAKTQTVTIAKSFKDMADDTLSALQRMTDAIRGGGFLNILSSVIGLGLQLGSVGLFGKKVAANINAPKIPAYAGGTNFHPGGLAIVGERGRELVNLPRGSSVTPNGAMGGNVYHITGNLMTPEFWAQIQAGDLAAADAGGNIGVQRVKQAGNWRLG